MVIKNPCKICNKAVAKTHAIKCDKCNLWVHTKCNKINLQTYKYQQKTTHDWYCLKCFAETIPFSKISNQEFLELKQGRKIKFKALALRQPDHNTFLIDKINDVINDPENETMSGKYYQVEELPPLMSDTENNFSFFHLNISSLPFHFEELQTLLTTYNLNFDILCISESRLKLNKKSLTSITLPGYTTTEANKGGTLIYIKNDIKYKLRKDLQIYKTKELESTFIEVIQPGKKKQHNYRLCLSTSSNGTIRI